MKAIQSQTVLPPHARSGLRFLPPLPVSSDMRVEDGTSWESAPGTFVPYLPASPFEAVHPPGPPLAPLSSTPIVRTGTPLETGHPLTELPPEEVESIIRLATRRVLAEQNPMCGPFNRPGLGTSLLWGMLALLTGRSFEEVAFEKTRGFRVEEIYLFGIQPEHVLLSFASRNPARHCSMRRITPLANRLRAELKRQRPDHGAVLSGFGPPDAAVWRSPSSVMLTLNVGKPVSRHLEDIGFVHSSVDRALASEIPGDRCVPTVWELQSLLEDALLINTPGPSR